MHQGSKGRRDEPYYVSVYVPERLALHPAAGAASVSDFLTGLLRLSRSPYLTEGLLLGVSEGLVQEDAGVYIPVWI